MKEQGILDTSNFMKVVGIGPDNKKVSYKNLAAEIKRIQKKTTDHIIILDSEPEVTYMKGVSPARIVTIGKNYYHINPLDIVFNPFDDSDLKIGEDVAVEVIMEGMGRFLNPNEVMLIRAAYHKIMIPFINELKVLDITHDFEKNPDLTDLYNELLKARSEMNVSTAFSCAQFYAGLDICMKTLEYYGLASKTTVPNEKYIAIKFDKSPMRSVMYLASAAYAYNQTKINSLDRGSDRKLVFTRIYCLDVDNDVFKKWDYYTQILEIFIKRFRPYGGLVTVYADDNSKTTDAYHQLLKYCTQKI